MESFHIKLERIYLYYFPKAVVTDYCKLSGLANRNCLIFLEARSQDKDVGKFGSF